MKYDIDEMIKGMEITSKAYLPEQSGNIEFIALTLALATLKDIKTERVMVPSEPTSMMERTVNSSITEHCYYGTSLDDDWFNDMLKAAPKSHIAELMESE